MKINGNDSCAFDEVSVIHSCAVIVPPAFQTFIGKQLAHKNSMKLQLLQTNLPRIGLVPAYFTPSPLLESHLIKATNELIEQTGVRVPQFLNIIKKNIIDQLHAFMEGLTLWKKISKHERPSPAKEFFIANERQLIKEKNIPEDDDCCIILGYQLHICAGSKYIISEDEHFWKYKELIHQQYGIIVIEEWNADKLI